MKMMFGLRVAAANESPGKRPRLLAKTSTSIKVRPQPCRSFIAHLSLDCQQSTTRITQECSAKLSRICVKVSQTCAHQSDATYAISEEPRRWRHAPAAFLISFNF